MIECYACQQNSPLARHVKLRGDVSERPPWGDGPPPGGAEGIAYRQYVQQTEYRSAFVCPACYMSLDSPDGTAEISGHTYAINGPSRGDKAAVYDVKKYEAFQRRQADKLGIFNP